MVKGVAVRFENYEQTIPKLLDVIKFQDEIRKHEKIVLKPNLANGSISESTSPGFVEQVLKFIMQNKNPETEVLIAEGCDGQDTLEVFEEQGYSGIAEKYGVGLVDLNSTETEEINNEEFAHFDSIHYPKVLLDSFIISLPRLDKSEETSISASLSNMTGAFPSKNYRSFFSKTKNKLRNIPLEYQIHDIAKCKMPNFALIDASETGRILAGQPLEMDKKAAELLGMNWSNIEHLNLMENGPIEEKPESLEA